MCLPSSALLLEVLRASRDPQRQLPRAWPSRRFTASRHESHRHDIGCACGVGGLQKCGGGGGGGHTGCQLATSIAPTVGRGKIAGDEDTRAGEAEFGRTGLEPRFRGEANLTHCEERACRGRHPLTSRWDGLGEADSLRTKMRRALESFSGAAFPTCSGLPQANSARFPEGCKRHPGNWRMASTGSETKRADVGKTATKSGQTRTPGATSGELPQSPQTLVEIERPVRKGCLDIAHAWPTHLSARLGSRRSRLICPGQLRRDEPT